MKKFDNKAFEQWLKYNSAPPEILLAASADSNPVVASASLVGLQAQQALQSDDAYTKASPSDRVAKLQQSPATGCAKLITLARQKSGYNAATPAAAGSSQMFLGFVNQILTCPLFHTLSNGKQELTRSGDWNNVINQIASYFVGVAPNDITEIKRSLTAIAAAASSSPSTNETLNVFLQSTLNVANNLKIYMYHTYVQMMTTVHKGGKNEPDKVNNHAAMTLFQVELLFDVASWPSMAAQVEQESTQSLRGWLNDMTTPQGNLAAGWSPS